MPRLNTLDVHNLERRIQELKNNIARASEERSRAVLSGDEKAAIKARIKASERTLENCEAIASYLNHLSPPLSNQIRIQGQNARNSLQRIKATTNAEQLHKWIKTELIPPTRMSEQLAHLAASSIRKVRGENLDFHKWTGLR